MSIGSISAVLAAAVVLFAATPDGAWGQSPPPAPKLGKPTQLLALQNRAAQPITQAEATISGGTAESFTANGAIQPNLGQKVYVPPGSCVTGVSVTFKDGRQLRLDNLNACRQALIVVTNDRIDLTSATSTNPPTRTLHSGQVLPH